MSNDWVKDIIDMQDKYGVHKWIHDNQNNKEKLFEYLSFRIKFVREELMETEAALTNNDAEEIVDGLIDLCVVAIGTLDAFGVDPYKAWDEVLKANLSKEVGVKESRPNPLGLPDLIKPESWEAPSHEGNHGKLNNIR
jgi:predicted HAD superfamily Cof-like phosphohydrolase